MTASLFLFLAVWLNSDSQPDKPIADVKLKLSKAVLVF